MATIHIDNLNVHPQTFLEKLSALNNVVSHKFHMFNKTLKLEVSDDWNTADQEDLNAAVLHSTQSHDYLEFEVEGAVINNAKELLKKIKQNNGIKNNIRHIHHDHTNHKLIVRVDNVDDPWVDWHSEQLDGVIDSLVGYDTVLMLMDGYEKKAKDGQQYYNLKRSELVERIYNPEDALTSEGAFQIDVKLKDVKDSLLTGDWITAQKYLAQTSTDGDYTEELKTNINQELGNYIALNYSF